MPAPLYSISERDYLNSIGTLITISDNFLNSLRESQLKFTSVGTHGRVDEVLAKLSNAQIAQVKELHLYMSSFNDELTKLIGRFQVVKNSYSKDSGLKNMLGDYSKDCEGAYKKLLGFTDGCLVQLDAVVTAYSKIEQEKKAAKTWVLTILSSKSSKALIKKAQVSNLLITELSQLIDEIRPLCHLAKLELLTMRNNAARHIGESEASSQTGAI